MNRTALLSALELAAAAIAAACLGGAVAFAIARIAPLGAGPVHALACGAVTALAAWMLVGRVDRQRGARGAPFAAVESIAAIVASGDGAPADGAGEGDGDDLLLLDDPLPPLAAESRVVQLFAAGAAGPAAPALTAPGEMVARIENFLGQPRGAQARSTHTDRAAASEEASAALHAALADIRRSLRQG